LAQPLAQPRTTDLNWDQIWKQFTGSARKRRGKLTDDDIQTLTGNIRTFWWERFRNDTASRGRKLKSRLTRSLTLRRKPGARARGPLFSAVNVRFGATARPVADAA
jgi:hypothetical protein